jgi:hypothetical protein
VIRPPVVALVTGALLAAALSYPTIVHPGSMARIDPGDAQFSVWNVAWVAHSLVDDPRHLFDANIFYPHQGTLAYSEANLVAGLIAAPVYAATRNPIVAYNVVVFLVLLAAFMAMWALVRRLTGSWTAALVSATGFAFSPYVASWTAEIQLLTVFVIPTALLAFHRFANRPGLVRAAVLGLALAVAGLSCAYYGIFAGLAVGLGALWFAFAQPSQRRYWTGLALAVVVACAIVAVPFRPYLALRHEPGARGALNLTEAQMYSADARAYLRSPASLDSWLIKVGPGGDALFPGAVVSLLAIAGFATWRRGATSTNGAAWQARRVIAFYAVLVVLAVWASFGPSAGLYSWLARLIPFMSFLRAPARLGVLVVFGLATVAGFGMHRLITLVRGVWLLPACVLLVAAEIAAIPWPLRPVPPVPEPYLQLAALPRGGVVEFHFPYKSGDLFHHARYMFGSIWHWQPLINGYSDYIPADFREMAAPINDFPDAKSFQILRAHQARYVVVHLDTYNDPKARAEIFARYARYRDYLRPIVQTSDTWLFEIAKWPD